MNRATFKRLGRPAVASIAWSCGYCALARRFQAGSAARILSYHSIGEHPADPYAVTPENFASQMAYLAERCAVLPMDELVSRLSDGRLLPTRAVAVTLDDGYRDSYTRAYPILARRGIPATIFLPVGFIGSEAAGHAAGRMTQADFLTWDEVREMGNGGLMTFGSHTMSHVSLTRVHAEGFEYELVRSKAELEDQIGRPVTGFAYPYGTARDFNRATAKTVAAAGYTWAVTGMNGLNTQQSDRFALRRTKIEGDINMALFDKAMQGALDPWVVVDKLGRLL